MLLETIVLRTISAIVPREHRRRWLSEWSAELEHAARAARRSGCTEIRIRARLTVRAAESVSDAMWLRYRAMRRGRPVEVLKHTIRALARRPTYALTVIGTLALGICAGTSIFAVVDSLMVRPPPFMNPDELVLISGTQSPVVGIDQEALRFWRSEDRVFSDVKARAPRSVILTGVGEARSYRAEMVEPGFLSLLGIPPRLGRPFTDEDARGDGRVLLLSDVAWSEVFGRDPGVLGRNVEIDGVPHTIVGVLPPTLRLMPGGIVHLLLPLQESLTEDRVTAVGRLSEGLSRDLAQARIDQVVQGFPAGAANEGGWQIGLWSFSRAPDPNVQRGLLALSAGVALLLLIAVANASGMFLLRGISRRPELRLRVALGASRRSILGEILAEGFLLALVAGALGTVLAAWSTSALTLLLPSEVVRFSYNPIAIDQRVLGFSVLLTMLAGLAFGLVPAWRAVQTQGVHGTRSATGSGDEARLRAAVQVAQVALALILMAGAGLFGRSFNRLMAADVGYAANEVLQLQLVPLERLRGESETLGMVQELDDRLKMLPGVTGLSRAAPGTGIMFDVTLETPQSEGAGFAVGVLPHLTVDTAYFRTMGIPHAEGRGFTAADVDAQDAVIIDQDLAERLWSGEPAVGRRFRVDAGAWLTVVGVTEDVRLDGPREPFGPYMLFYPGGASDRELRSGLVILRSSSDPATLVPAVRRTVAAVDPDQPVRSLQTGREALRDRAADPRLLSVIMSILAGAAILLAGIGVYGLVSFNVVQRRREIGVRIALGARSGQVMMQVVRSGFVLGLLGVLIGFGVIVIGSRLLAGLLYETAPLDLTVLLGASLTLLVSCVVAVLAPAWHAAAADPVRALRAE